MSSVHTAKSSYEYKPNEEFTDLCQYICAEAGRSSGSLNEVFSKKTMTMKEVKQAIDNIAQNLYQDHGFQPGDYFAIYSFNSIDYLLVVLAVWKLGGIFVGISPFIQPGSVLNELQRQLKIADSKFLLVHPMTASGAKRSIGGTKVQKIFVSGECSEKDCIPISTLLKDPAKTVSLPSTPVNMKDACAVYFSNGTTGLPKASEIAVQSVMCLLYVCGDPSFHDDISKNIVFQPMSTGYGIGLGIVAIKYKYDLYIMERFDLMVYLKVVADFQVPVMSLVPAIAVLLAKTDLDPNLDLSCIQTVYVGADSMRKELADALDRKFGHSVYYRQVYAMTETACPITLTPKKGDPDRGERMPEGSVGKVVAGHEIMIRSLVDKKTLAPGSKGEICVRGPLVMNRYIQPPKSCENSIDEHGWFHTGDVGYLDKNGYLFFVDRVLDMIKYKSHYVSPSELDDVLLSHPSIADAGVTGIPDVDAGDVPYAWVVLKPGKTLTENDLQLWVSEKVMDPKKLRGGIKFVPAIPRGTIGKIIRREIRQSKLDEMNKKK